MITTLYVVFGTRPEWIKLEPLVRYLRMHTHGLRVQTVYTGQQRAFALQYAQESGEQPDARVAFDFSSENPALYFEKLYAALQAALHPFADLPSSVLVQGDTFSALAGAYCARHLGMRLIHLEAGLRTFDPAQPFPEENIRVEIATLAHLHLATTPQSRKNLLAEGIADAHIRVTGNTLATVLLEKFAGRSPVQDTVLVSCHRRENKREAVRILADSLLRIARDHPALKFVWLRHPNLAPEISELLQSGHLPNLQVQESVGFTAMLEMYRRTTALITDSGGMQEEALCLGIPALIYRAATERPECIEAGTGLLCTPGNARVESLFEKLLSMKPVPRPDIYQADGAVRNAAGEIFDFLGNGRSYLTA